MMALDQVASSTLGPEHSGETVLIIASVSTGLVLAVGAFLIFRKRGKVHNAELQKPLTENSKAYQAI